MTSTSNYKHRRLRHVLLAFVAAVSLVVGVGLTRPLTAVADTGAITFDQGDAVAKKWIPRVGSKAVTLSWDSGVKIDTSGYAARYRRELDAANGLLEADITYTGNDNFSIIFRGQIAKNKHLNSLVYTGGGNWVVRELDWQNGWVHSQSQEPIKSPVLKANTKYRVGVRYNGEALTLYLDGKEFYKSDAQKVKELPDGAERPIATADGKVGFGSPGKTSFIVHGLSLKEPTAEASVPEWVDTPAAPYQPICRDLKPLPAPAESLEAVRKRWAANLVGTADEQTSGKEPFKSYIADLNKRGNQLWQDMRKTTDQADPRNSIFKSLDPKADKASYIRGAFGLLLDLTRAYVTKGTDLYGRPEVLHEIRAGLDHMVVTKSYDGKHSFGNWWPWQIGGPQRFVAALILLRQHGDLSAAESKCYANFINGYVPNPYKQINTIKSDKPQPIQVRGDSAGANRIDMAQVVAGVGVLTDDPAKLSEAVKAISPYLRVVKDNGFRDDGSYVDHTSFAYTGGYGAALLKGAGKILSVVAGTKYGVSDEVKQELGRNLVNGVLPNMYHGEFLPSLKGRGLTRMRGLDIPWGQDPVFDLAILADSLNPKDRKAVREATRYWLDQNPKYYYSIAGTFLELAAANRILGDSSLANPSMPGTGIHMYPQMDRFVDKTPDYLFNIGMHSARISSYEVGAKENVRGWHFGDGMTYLFNGDDQQFHSRYWPTVDPYRLPGITVDTRPLEDDLTSYQQRPAENAHWVGGAASNDAAAVGQQLDKTDYTINNKSAGMDLRAKKSWFVLPGRIVALGSDINGSTVAGADIETVVENRLLNPELKYQLTNAAGNTLSPGKLSETDLLLKSAADPKKNIGYALLDGTRVNYSKNDRSGHYLDINKRVKAGTEQISASYATLVVNHGQSVKDGSYGYILVPGATSKSLKAARAGVKVLANTKQVQAVEAPGENLLLANVFADSGTKVTEGLKTSGPVSLVRSVKGNEVTYSLAVPIWGNAPTTRALDGTASTALADPRWGNAPITITLAEPVADAKNADGTITATGKTITFNPVGLQGKTRSITLRSAASSEAPSTNPTDEPTAKPDDTSSVEPSDNTSTGAKMKPTAAGDSQMSETGSTAVTVGLLALILIGAGATVVLARRRLQS